MKCGRLLPLLLSLLLSVSLLAPAALARETEFFLTSWAGPRLGPGLEPCRPQQL